MRATRRVLLSWSSGKDCAWALHELRRDPTVEVIGLLTVIDEGAGHVPMHHTPRDLVRMQASRTGLPLHEVHWTADATGAAYEREMRAALERIRALGATDVAFGDIFLADLRAERERKMRETGLGVLFPLWNRDTGELAREMIRGGLRARITYVDTDVLPVELLGREFDRSFLSELPGSVDPCGEHGEFHSLAFAGPMFSSPIDFRVEEAAGRHLRLGRPTG
ncbi:ATP-binding protein [Vulgatibacter sp.]|uniref:Dph6-related ATP pyrophosphatase n=1 Tax=Vulgatibacter sp. TaxID=1971226 RepID=UPI00356852B8